MRCHIPASRAARRVMPADGDSREYRRASQSQSASTSESVLNYIISYEIS
jgi:hypothetical protein